MRTKDIAFGLIIGVLMIMEGAHVVEKWQSPPPPTAAEIEARKIGRELDRRFVEALILRYKDTVQLAEEESRNGRNPELRRLAAALVEARRNDLDSLMKLAASQKSEDQAPSVSH